MSIDRDFIRLLWQNRMFADEDLQFIPDGRYSIEDLGMDVDGAAADFSGVVLQDLRTGASIVGGVRIDCKSSDWRVDGSLSDPSFDGIVLHVVADHDVQLLRRGRTIPTCVITPSKELVDHYHRMRVGCDQAFESMDNAERESVLTRLLDQRIDRKTSEVLSIIDTQKGSWHEAAYICFMRALGSATERKEDFENIARSLPYGQILTHADRLQLVEALMLGQAGHLDVENPDCYIESLQREFIATRDKNGMLPAVIKWKQVRHRPYSSLPLTLARAAAVLCKQENLFEEILRLDHIDDLRSLFVADVSPYWQEHSAPMKGEGKIYGSFSRDKADLIIINFVIPMLLAHASINGDQNLSDRAVKFYMELPAETHKFSRRWTAQRWRPRQAYDSQALVQLGREYCEKSLCAKCPIGGNSLLSKWKEMQAR